MSLARKISHVVHDLEQVASQMSSGATDGDGARSKIRAAASTLRMLARRVQQIEQGRPEDH